jgi:hypothetical protein
MATLTRPKLVVRPATSPRLNSAVPAPFPRELLQEREHLNQDVHPQSETHAAASSLVSEADDVGSSTIHILVSK